MSSPSKTLRPSRPARRDPRSGTIRPAGLAAALVTAGAVFGLGLLILPPIEPAAPPPPAPAAPPAAPAPPPPPPPVAADAASAAAPSPDAGAPTDAKVADTTVAEPEVSVPAAPTPPPAAPARATAELAPAPIPKTKTPPSDDAAPAKAEAPAPHDKLADKEVARDAWRKNLPDIAPEPGKSAMLIPIKGSVEGATYHVTAKPRSVLITLPKGESMITMPFYNVRHDGFRQLWIKKDDDAGTTIRVVLGDASDPQVEIKEDFVRVTVRRSVEASTPAAADGAAPAPSAAAAAPSAPAPAPATASPPSPPASPPPARD